MNQTQTAIRTEAIERAEAHTANAEVNAEMGALCQALGAPIGAVKLLPSNILYAFLFVRMFKKLSLKLRELDIRVNALEARSEEVPPAYEKKTVQ